MSESSSPIEVLIVEDDPQDAELIVDALERQHLEARRCVARDGVEALDILFGSRSLAPPRLILLDLKLSKVDGFEVLRRIKNDDRTRYTTVVILTSSDMENDIKTAYALGANGYIVKPSRYESFMEIVGDVGVYWLRVNRSPTTSDA